MWVPYAQIVESASPAHAGLPGFLPFSRGSFMLDVVVCAMVAILPTLTWSIYLVKVRRDYQAHKRIQVALGLVLLIAVGLFELDIRLFGWRHLAEPSPYYNTWLFPVLYVHLLVACTTSVLWVVTLIAALRRFSSPAAPGPHSRWHRRLAKPAAASMYLTAITGWIFYWMAFVAS